MAAARQPHQRAAAAERPSLANLSSCITCTLCRGYLIDAVTLVKCLHSFCKSCILKRLEKDSTCPVCDLRISTMKLDLHLKKDDALQNIVYKAVPGLYQREMKRRRDFYGSRSKGDKTTLTPEERGELDDSSKGRVIFSPDEAISLSLEYKHLSSKGEKCKTEKQDPSFKEPPKRYLNCPAAVTIALLQKFLRMKYSIGAKSRIDIFYMNEVLWSKYTLMDVAYIYSWRRDAPLELSFWIWEPASKLISQPYTESSVGGNLGPPQTNPSSTETCDSSKSSEYLRNSIAFTEHDGRHTKGDVIKSKTSKGPEDAFTDSPAVVPAEKSSTSSSTTCRQPNEVQSTTAATGCKSKTEVASLPEETNPRSPLPEGNSGKRCDRVPDTPHKSNGASSAGDEKEARIVNKSDMEASTTRRPDGEKAVSVADDSGCARTSGSFFRRTSASKPRPANGNDVECPKNASEAPTIATGVNNEASGTLETTIVSKEVSKSSGPASVKKEMPGNSEQEAVQKACTSADVSSAKDATAESAERNNTLKSERAVASACAVNGVDDDIFKTWRSASTGKHLAGAIEKKPTTVAGSTVADESKQAPEIEPVKTCVSRAADKAEAKLNALRAAAASAKSKGEANNTKETKLSDSGARPVAAAGNNVNSEALKKEEKSSNSNEVIGAAADSKSDLNKSAVVSEGNEVVTTVKNGRDKLEKEEDKSRKSSIAAVVTSTVTAQSIADVTKCSEECSVPASSSENCSPKQSAEAVTSSTEEAPSTENVEAVTTTVDSSLPTYLTLSRSHPSLFHSAPRKRGRPKLATVNSLNEEVERAHVLAKQAAALEKTTKPVIPVITTLRIKPILPPPDKPEEKSPTKKSGPPKETESSRHGDQSGSEDGRRKSKRRRTTAEQPSKETQPERCTAAADSSLGSPRNLATPEKITIRVTRDETCTLKVEKLQRVVTTLSADGLHDSGFCEDVSAEKSPASNSKAKDALERGDKRTSHHAKQQLGTGKKCPEEIPSTRKEIASKNEKAKEKAVLTIKVAPLRVPEPRGKSQLTAKVTEPRKESRKCKRKSVEEWVNEQNRWIHSDKQKFGTGRQTGPGQAETAKPVDGRHAAHGPNVTAKPGNLAKRPAADDHPPKNATQRRGRKRANPVKIEKLALRIESQQVSAPPAAVPAALPTILGKVTEKGESNSKESARVRHEGESSPPNTPKRPTELIIPKYVPNPATSIPLTVAHARNKRLKEAVVPKTCLNLSACSGASKPTVEQQRGDSEKSKFFKEVLNLSMKQTPKAPQTFSGSPPAPKKPDSLSPQKSKEAASPSETTEAVERIAASQKWSAAHRDGAAKNAATVTSTASSADKVNSVCDRNPHAAAKEQNRSRLMGKMLVSRTSNRSRQEKHHRSPSPKPEASKKVGVRPGIKAEAKPAPADVLARDAAETEILPKLNDTGVFRLEFPGDGSSAAPDCAEASPEGGNDGKPTLPLTSSNHIPIENRDDVAESIKNIARIRKTILESQQQSAGASKDVCASKVENSGEATAARGAAGKDVNSIPTAKKELQVKNVKPQTPNQLHLVTKQVTKDGTRLPISLQVEQNEAYKASDNLPVKETHLVITLSPSCKEQDGISSLVKQTAANNHLPTATRLPRSVKPGGKQHFTASNMRSCKSASPPISSHGGTCATPRQSTIPSPKHRSSRPLQDAEASRRTPPASAHGRIEAGKVKTRSPDRSCRVSHSPSEVSRRSNRDKEAPSCRSPIVKHDSDVPTASLVSQNKFSNRAATANVVRIKTEKDLPENADDRAEEDTSLAARSNVRLPERHNMSSSNETRADATLSNARASEHMYRTTVAEIDLFTALSIIETIKGRATVHDIVEDYVTHLGKFFSTLEASDWQTQRLVEEAFRSKRPVLLRLVGLLKKLTLDLSSSQVSQVFALEVLIERFLSRYAEDIPATVSEDGDRGVSGSGRLRKSVMPVPVEPVYSAEDLAEPPLVPMRTAVLASAASRQRGRRRHSSGGRVEKATRSKLWKRRLAHILKLEEPLWLLPLIPGPRNAPNAVALRLFPTAFAGALCAVEESECCLPHFGTSTALCPAEVFRPASHPLRLATHFDARIPSISKSFLHLVNPNTNGQRPSVVQNPHLVEAASPTTCSKSLVSGRLRLPKSLQFEQTFVAAVCELLGGDRVRGCLAASEVPSGKICLETDKSSLVITAPGTNNKLVLSAEVGHRLLTGLLTRMGWENNCCLDLESLFAALTKQKMARFNGPTPFRGTRCGRLLAVGAGTEHRSVAPPGRNTCRIGAASCGRAETATAVVHPSCQRAHTHRAASPGSAHFGRTGPLGESGVSTATFLAVEASGNEICPSPTGLASRGFGTNGAPTGKRCRTAASNEASPASHSKRTRISTFTAGSQVLFRKKLAVCTANRNAAYLRSNRVEPKKVTGPAAADASHRPPSDVPGIGLEDDFGAAAASRGVTSAGSLSQNAEIRPADVSAESAGHTPLKRPAQDEVASPLPPLKRQQKSLHIPVIRGERRIAVQRPPSSVVPRDRMTLLRRCPDPAKRRRRAKGDAERKPKPVASR